MTWNWASTIQDAEIAEHRTDDINHRRLNNLIPDLPRQTTPMPFSLFPHRQLQPIDHHRHFSFKIALDLRCMTSIDRFPTPSFVIMLPCPWYHSRGSALLASELISSLRSVGALLEIEADNGAWIDVSVEGNWNSRLPGEILRVRVGNSTMYVWYAAFW